MRLTIPEPQSFVLSRVIIFHGWKTNDEIEQSDPNFISQEVPAVLPVKFTYIFEEVLVYFFHFI